MNKIKKIRVDLGRKSYDIIVCNKGLGRLGAIAKKIDIGTDAVVITNRYVKKILGNPVKKSLTSAGFNVNFQIIPDSEKAKSEKCCIRLLNNISKIDGASRRIFIIALGGGVTGDLAGFVASIYKRGVPYIQVPTTLLAQVDSAIGGKVAIDLEVGKNLAGAFYQPRIVFSDVSLLNTLPKKDLVSGMAEVIKYGVIKSPGLFNFLTKNHNKVLKYDKKSLEYIVYTCSVIKAKVVEKDEFDNKNIRVILNLGHTIGHAIEAGAHYAKAYNHGQAVSLGIIAALFISRNLNLIDKNLCKKISDLIKKIGLPTSIKGKKLDTKDIFSAQEHDKKFIRGKNRFVLPVKIGKVIVKENIPKALIKKSIASLFNSVRG